MPHEGPGRRSASAHVLGALLCTLLCACDAKFSRSGSLPVIQATAIRAFADSSRVYGSVLAEGDLTGDGIPDLVIGCPAAVEDVKGIVVVVDGKTAVTHAVLASWLSDSERVARFGSSLAVGDFDADGNPDLAVGNPSGGPEDVDGAGEVLVYFGPIDASRFELIQASEPRVGGGFGSTLCALDLDGDGDDDLVAGEPETSPERVCVALGPDLAEVLVFETAAPGDGFGSALAAAGPRRLFVGAPSHRDDEGEERGAGYLLESDGESVQGPTRIDPQHRQDAGFAASLAVGDFDGDAVPDQMISALGGESPGLYFYSQVDEEGTRIPFDEGRLPSPGSRILPVRDVSGDGRDELLVLSPPDGTVATLLYSPSRLSTRVTLPFPIASAVSGDYDDDGEPELLVAVPWNYRQDELGVSLLYLVDFSTMDVSD